MIEEVTVDIESVHTPDAMMLIEQLSHELAARYEEDEDEGKGAFTPTDMDVPGTAFIVARLDGRAVGCGAVRPFADERSERLASAHGKLNDGERSDHLSDTAEIKRMFVLPEFRGRGISKRILVALEEAARGFGYRGLVLETGVRQPEAIALYERAGFTRMPCYGKYVNNPWSVCMEKQI